ncbi:unnamed protein product [Diabrotica balteata]|uniref:Uncharacterized protein n=1 Tax=Diabrotica balteata TaxID=107213 RepID=A0A9N9XBH4_DIABA|nr:unnamed protein product [Diabrotica balteata]
MGNQILLHSAEEFATQLVLFSIIRAASLIFLFLYYPFLLGLHLNYSIEPMFIIPCMFTYLRSIKFSIFNMFFCLFNNKKMSSL